MGGSPPDDRCGYTFPEYHEVGHEPTRQSCCWRAAASSEETERCLWHADPDRVPKTVESLREARVPPGQHEQETPDLRNRTAPVAELLDGINVAGVELGDALSFTNVSLREADLSGADLKDADLSGATLWNADLSGATLWNADLSGATLWNADLSGANLRRADLSGAFLLDADLSDANLRRADLSDADLRGTNLFRIDVRSLRIDDVDDVAVSSRTKISSFVPLRTGFRHRPIRPFSLPDLWAGRARGYERLRKVFGAKGLDDHHRTLYSYQRRARAKEALRTGRVAQWLGNYFSRILTGHGVLISRVFFWTAVVMLLPWYWYGLVDGWTDDPIRGGPLYYSVVTFVTSPPHPIPQVHGSIDLLLTSVDLQSVNRAVVLFQTYAGTALIILLGYVLGNRDRI